MPCQVWSTGFFDKNVVGTANALTGGFRQCRWRHYLFHHARRLRFLRREGYAPGPAWRLTFIIPLVFVILTGVCLLLLCPDTPDGSWKDRALHAQQNFQSHAAGASPTSVIVDVPGAITDKTSSDGDKPVYADEKKPHPEFDHEAAMTQDEMIQAVEGEVIQKPTLKEALPVIFSLQTVFHIATYMCSFGGELAINSILASYYSKNFPLLSQTEAANWAAMFGFLNFVSRPLGGVISDLLYTYLGKNLWYKKAWILTCGIVTGAVLIIIGQLDPHNQSTMYGLIALMAFFLEAGNGANFALVPHVHPFANGIVSGLTGAGGNLGGVIFAIIFRFVDGGTNYAKGILDHRSHAHWSQPVGQLDPAPAEGPAWWPLRAPLCFYKKVALYQLFSFSLVRFRTLG